VGDGDRPGLKRELVELIHEVADVGMDGAHPVFLFDSAEGIDDLWIMESAAEQLLAASKGVLDEIRHLMATDVGEFGSIRLGETLYRVGKKWERKVIDGQDKMLLDWLGVDLKTAVPASAVRITAVRAVAEKRGLKGETVEDTFYVIESDPDDPYELQRLTGSRLPKYFAAMKHGDRR
jgi:hypothetical protein